MSGAFQSNAFQTKDPKGNNAFQLTVDVIGGGGGKKRRTIDYTARAMLDDNEAIEIYKVFLSIQDEQCL